MAVAYGSSASNSKTLGGGAETLVVTAPTSIAEGDFLVAVLGKNGATNEWSFEAGWTQFHNHGGGTETKAWWKIADTDDANATDFTFSSGGSAGSDVVGAFVVRITGTNGFTGAGNISSTSDDNTSGATGHTFTPGIDSLSADALWLIGSVAYGDSVVTQSGYAITNNDPTWTEREDLGEDGGSLAVSLAVATANASALADSGDYSLTLSGSAPATGFLISVEETTNVTVNAGVMSAAGSLLATSVAAAANVSAGVMSAAGSLLAATVDTFNATVWTNETEPSSTWTNEDKI